MQSVLRSETLYSEKEVTLQDALEHGLNEEEYKRIREILGGRSPTVTELGIYSGLWSEHCSYKNSILQLKTLPTESKRAIAKAGEENAGALDIGDGLAVVFKIESHNHPTAVEPYQGAATGVGGIMRDIFTMGARPICSLNSLRFGPPEEKRNRFLFTRAVKGIGDYGNCLGVPVLGGEVFFDPSFSRNPLVNAMTVGVVPHDGMASATAGDEEGHPVFVVGATTGRDGIHGASFASQDLTEESESKRSAVQVGDPFMEKLLLEASLELIASGRLIGIQDMGAAGLSCSSSEMSAKGGVGMELDLDLVPLREEGMNAYEIMLSESQERMLVVVRRGEEEHVQKIFEKWELHVQKIGEVQKDGLLVVKREGKVCSAIPADSLVLGGGAPRYVREQRRPEYLDRLSSVDADAPAYFAENTASQESLGNHRSDGLENNKNNLTKDFLNILARPNVCSRRPVYEQYDSEVGLARVAGPGANAGVARIFGSKKGIAVSTDCNSRYVYLDPFNGTRQAVHEAARNVAMTGSLPIGVTNCLNFGNPYIPENYYVFAEAIRGMREACLALDAPVTGGNVSFYNESDDGPVLPTPTIGMVGLIEDAAKAVSSNLSEKHFRKTAPASRHGEVELWLLGSLSPSFGGSEYQAMKAKPVEGRIPSLDTALELKIIEFMTKAADSGLVLAARDLSLGGLAVALFKLCYDSEFRRLFGFALDAKKAASCLSASASSMEGITKERLFFGETNGAAVLAISATRAKEAESLAQRIGISLVQIGRAVPDSDSLDFGDFKLPAAEAISSFEGGLIGVF